MESKPTSPQTRPPLQYQYSCMVPTHVTTISTANGAIDRKALRDTLYSGIFYKHRRTIFALGSFLRMLKSRNSDYNVIKGEPEND